MTQALSQQTLFVLESPLHFLLCWHVLVWCQKKFKVLDHFCVDFRFVCMCVFYL